MAAIHDYGIVGDGRSVALISRAGSIDWLCWPRLDSAPIFARLLDPDGGTWRITPRAAMIVRRRYIDDTNVLETTFEDADGRCTLIDVMTVESDHELVRLVRCDEGEVELEVYVQPWSDVGRARVRVSYDPGLGVRWEVGASLLSLRAEVPLHVDEHGVAHGLIRLHAGESCTLSMTFDEDGPAVLPSLGDLARDRIERSCAWWSSWAGRARYSGPYRDQVIRSLLAVKLMAFTPSGGVHDAAFTARALLQLGYVEDAEAFCSSLLRSTRLTQLQLDGYGEVIDATAQVAQAAGHLDRDTQALLRDFGDVVMHNWRLHDPGITHSRLLCWVALERLAELAAAGLVDGVDRRHLMRECAAIRADIETHAFDPVLASYTGTLGGHDLDARALLMSWYGFHSASAPRMRSTYGRIASRLSAGPGMFWAVEHLARGGGTHAQAQTMMDAACSYANDVGLMAEEVDPVTREALGNFPQQSTHVGLIGAAVSLEQQSSQRTVHPPDPHHARQELRW